MNLSLLTQLTAGNVNKQNLGHELASKYVQMSAALRNVNEQEWCLHRKREHPTGKMELISGVRENSIDVRDLP